MNEPKNPFDDLPGFEETIARIIRVPSESAPQKPLAECVYQIKDEANGITYRIVTPKKLNASDVRRVLARAFSRTDVWPNESGEVEIRV